MGRNTFEVTYCLFVVKGRAWEGQVDALFVLLCLFTYLFIYLFIYLCIDLFI